MKNICLLLVVIFVAACSGNKHDDMYALNYRYEKEKKVHQASLDSIAIGTNKTSEELRAEITKKLDDDSIKGILLIWPDKK